MVPAMDQRSGGHIPKCRGTLERLVIQLADSEELAIGRKTNATHFARKLRQRPQRLACSDIPHPGAAIASRGDRLTVRSEGEAVHLRGMSAQCPQEFSRGGIPKSNRAI